MIYCILDIDELNDVNYGQVIQDSADTVRKNLADEIVERTKDILSKIYA